MTLPTRAWAWNLRAHKDNLDPLALAILRREELFLCRIVLGIVEHENETIESIDLTISHTPGTNYKLFPTEKHRPSTSLSAKVGGHLAIGLTRGLDIVPAESSNNTLNAHLVWRGDWRWAAAVLKSSGVGHPEARWRLTRLREAPFAGDREFFTILQLPKRSEPGVVSASLSANIQPSGLQKTIFKYEMATDGPIDIPYFVS